MTQERVAVDRLKPLLLDRLARARST
jgi:hypothetical protein